MRSYLKKVSTNYKLLIDQARNTEMIVSSSSIQVLIAIAVGLASIALVGNTLSGYHFAFMEINRFSSNISPVLLENMTVFGDGVFLLALILLLSNRQVRFHWTILFTSLLSAIVVNVLKDYFAMPRPPAVLDAEAFNLIGRAYQARSFPSGHSATAFLLATVCFCYAQNAYFKAALILLAVLVGLSRILIGVHWPMDVLVGGALGIVLGLTGVMVTAKWKFGLCAPVHLFTLGLMVIACIMIFVDGNDYKLAMPMLYVVAAAALVQTIRNYIWVK
ncbi:phosphatase PAP2 family protein [Marinomonas sp.]|uniref:phosphatase PAP2 family protein n=1 Tax=Marinomonas sp. TaxID=1904862 RepID=UPI003BA8DE5D